ncbi:hypothetical protein ABEV74_13165 [Paenibacillus cisolokensis]|uniref:hypothetical protein n=1 Tax=Paenibacillus cisolokensis TaxID=1658519 RepID=UPI003D2CA5B4
MIKHNIIKQIIVCGTVTILFLFSFISEKHFITGEPHSFGYTTSKILYVVYCYFIVLFLYEFIKKIINKEIFYRKWFKNLSYIFVPYIGILFLSWPGLVVWDEIWIYQNATQFHIDDWQSYQTVYFYIFSLFLIPSFGMIVGSQITFMAFVSSWIITKLEFNYPLRFSKYKLVLIIIIVLSPAVLFNTLMTFRSTMLAIIELWLVGLIYFSFKEKKCDNKTLIIIGFLTILLSTWRKEGIYHVIFVPIAIWYLGIAARKRIVVFTLVTIVGVLVAGNIYGLIKGDEKQQMRYELTAFINPLSMILADKNAIISEETSIQLNKVIDVEKTKEMASPYEVPSYWNGAVKDDFSEKDFKSFKKSYLKIVIDNLDIFLSSRTRTMISSSGFSRYGYYPSDYINSYILKNLDNDGAKLMLDNSLNRPININLRQFIVNILNWSKSFDNNIPNTLIFWNFSPVFIYLVIVIIRMRSLQNPIFWISVLLLLRVPLLFITQPGSYFMYYYPMFLPGVFLMIIHFLEVKRRKSLAL